MKTQRTLVLLVGLSLSMAIGLIVYSQMGELSPKMIIIYALTGLVAIASIYIAIRKMKDEKEGQPAEDELSTQIKHKSGYLAYIASLYMWLFVFLFRDLFPDSESMVGGGILISALIGYICKSLVKKQYYEK